MRIAIGSDHRGVQLKAKIHEFLMERGFEVQDEGPHSADSVDYPDFAAAVCRKVAAGDADRGILICGTGIGMAIAANKVPGIRAAVCNDELAAEMSRRHNDLNVLCLAADVLGNRNIDRLLELWLTTEFEGGRHARRIEKIDGLEDQDRPC
ncbi:MAG: ribose 5-phosphate isomerase B [Planctomycetales bacterium]|nr:ribose 5-phosphate isomerase B [Planctomycetales bacterium]